MYYIANVDMHLTNCRYIRVFGMFTNLCVILRYLVCLQNGGHGFCYSIGNHASDEHMMKVITRLLHSFHH